MKRITYPNGFTEIIRETEEEINEFYRKTANVRAFIRPQSAPGPVAPDSPDTEEQAPEEPPSKP